MIEVWHPIGGQLVRAGRGTIGDPIPTELTATPGNAQIGLTWVAPAPATGVTDYQVQFKLATSSTWSTFTDAVSTTPAVTVTGLTNGTAYDLRVAAVRSGVVGSFTAPVRATPRVTAASPTIFGYNYDNRGTFNQTLAGREAWWSGRAPCVRLYDSNMLPAAFQFTLAQVPEKRFCYSFKPDSSGSFTAAGLAAGNGNARITSWASSVPANHYGVLVFEHEANSKFKKGAITPATYLAIYAQIRTALDAATLHSGVTLLLSANFMSFNLGGYWDDAWVPPGIDLLTWDVYGNPGEFTTQVTGAGYGTSYPKVSTRWRDVFAITDRLGYADRWGVLEFNTPGRDWDTTPVGEAQRRQWLVDFIDYGQAPPMTGSVPPKVFMLWEHPLGTFWNQSFGRVGGNPHTCADALAPYILGTPVGG